MFFCVGVKQVSFFALTHFVRKNLEFRLTIVLRTPPPIQRKTGTVRYNSSISLLCLQIETMSPREGFSEVTPLLLRKLTINEDDQAEKGQATVTQTVLNLSKTCMGTGCLALAYGCQQSGVFAYIFGLAGIAAWNVYAVDRLVRCRSHMLEAGRRDEEASGAPTEDASDVRKRPPESTSTLGKVAYFAFGPTGLEVMDVLMIILLLGIVISYLSAVISFLSDTPLTVGPLGDSLIVACFMALLSLVPDLGHLSGISGVGLLILGGTFAVIAGYGLRDYWGATEDMPELPLWPSTNEGISHFFGVSVFGFGMVPLTYNIQESMKRPHLMVPATAGALGGVAIAYIVLGVGLSVLFPNVSGEILHELPSTGWLPTTTRLAMAVVSILTTPLLIVPAGELLEGKFGGNKAISRFGVCFTAAIVAVLLPSFVQVLAFVGCACVGCVSFCVPPILHMRLVWMRRHDAQLRIRTLLFDTIVLVWGIIATVLGTIYAL